MITIQYGHTVDISKTREQISFCHGLRGTCGSSLFNKQCMNKQHLACHHIDSLAVNGSSFNFYSVFFSRKDPGIPFQPYLIKNCSKRKVIQVGLQGVTPTVPNSPIKLHIPIPWPPLDFKPTQDIAPNEA